MESIKFQDIGVEKANAISTYRRIQRITTLLRFLEVFVFLIVLSTFFSTHFACSLKLSSEYFRGISLTLISPKSVFVIGNAIVIALIVISGQFSAKTTDFYDEYVEKCRNYNPQVAIKKLEKKVSDTYRSSSCSDEKKIIRRVHSEHLVRVEQRDCSLRRSMSDKCGRKAANEMSSEEFRRTVEAFIERQQRFLKEEEEEEEQLPAAGPFSA